MFIFKLQEAELGRELVGEFGLSSNACKLCPDFKVKVWHSRPKLCPVLIKCFVSENRI